MSANPPTHRGDDQKRKGNRFGSKATRYRSARKNDVEPSSATQAATAGARTSLGPVFRLTTNYGAQISRNRARLDEHKRLALNPAL